MLKDLVTGIERPVAESSASRTVQTGDVLFAQVVHAAGLWLLECCSRFAFPPIAQIQIAEACRRLVGRRKKSIFPLRDYDLEMLEIYHAVADPLINPRLPTMQNTEGEPLSMRKIVFDIESAERACGKQVNYGINDRRALAERHLPPLRRDLQELHLRRRAPRALQKETVEEGVGTLVRGLRELIA